MESALGTAKSLTPLLYGNAVNEEEVASSLLFES